MHDFQESQAFLAATISITALITFDGGNKAGLANMLTLLSWMFNHRILQGLVTAGMYPVLMAQLIMHRARKRHFNTLLFVILSWILMTVITEVQDFDADAFEQHLKQVSGVGDCGNMPGPMSFCQGTKAKKSYEFFSKTMACRYVVHVITYLLIIDYIIHFVKTRFARDKIEYTQLAGAKPLLLSFAENKSVRRALSVLWLAAETLTVSMIIISLLEMVQLLDMHAAEGGISTWGFGQLVAVAIWFPVMIKFFSLNLGKLLLSVCVLDILLTGTVGPKKEVVQLHDKQDATHVLELTTHPDNKVDCSVPTNVCEVHSVMNNSVPTTMLV